MKIDHILSGILKSEIECEEGRMERINVPRSPTRLRRITEIVQTYKE